MKLSDVFKIFRKNFLLLIFFPSLLAGLVFYQTKDEEKEYTSSFLVYTGIASGLTITTDENQRIDHNVVNNAFDNLLTTLKARESIEEVGIRLLVSHVLLNKPDPAIISENKFHHLKNILPDTMRARIRNAKSKEDAIDVVYKYKYAPGSNPVKTMLNSGDEVYGVPLISSKLTAKRKDLSDMLEVSYTANDPAVCQQTLEILSDVFIRRYREIKRGEINRVVAYFEKQTNTAKEKLRQAEDQVKNFGIKHKIINFDEQTKTISETKQNLQNNIEKESLMLTSAQATIRNLESKISMRKGLMETNEKIVAKRQKLSNLNYKIANASISDSDNKALAKMQMEAEELKDEIKVVVNELYQINNSTDGMPRADLMTQWLNNILIADESAARLKIMEARLKEFDGMYNEYAPLGATLNRLEREVEVAEKEYMAQLNSYNMNKERQQNIAMESNVKIVDRPFYPLEAQGSKRMLLVIGSFLAGFMLIFAGLIAAALLDTKIKTPGRAEEFSGLRIAGLMPVSTKQRRYDLEYIESSLMEQTISVLALEMSERGKANTTKCIMVSSPNPEEGKTWCAYKLASKLSEIKGRVLFLYPQSVSEEVNGMNELRLEEPSLELVEYEIKKDFMNIESLAQLSKKQIDLKEYSYVLIEIPPLIDHQLPVELVKKMDIALLVLRADRTWSETDTYVSKLYSKASSFEPLLILNRVSLESLKNVFGNIPKRRVKKERIPKTNKRMGDQNSKTLKA